MYIRVSQTIVLSSQTENFLLTTTFSHYLGQRHCKKNRFWKILFIIWPGSSRSKFYCITHLCKMGLSRKFIFKVRVYFFLFETKSYMKNIFFVTVFTRGTFIFFRTVDISTLTCRIIVALLLLIFAIFP